MEQEREVRVKVRQPCEMSVFRSFQGKIPLMWLEECVKTTHASI